MENNGREIEDRRLPWGPNGTRRATGASNGVEYGVSDEELCGARVEVLRVVHRSPSGGACTRQVHADNTRGASGGRARAHLLLGSACGPTAVRRALHGHTHTTLPACGRTRLGSATRARFPEAAADAETAIAGCGSRCGQPNLVTTTVDPAENRSVRTLPRLFQDSSKSLPNRGCRGQRAAVAPV